jgi:hypothetical protein
MAGMETGYWANAGAPMSRSRSQAVMSSLLQGDQASFQCCARLGVDFGKRDPQRAVRLAMRAARIREPEALRERFAVPAEPWLCREVRDLAVPRVQELTQEQLLEHALLLGLCTPWLLDPRRPVLLTHAALTRRLEVYAFRGFYA